MRCRKLTLIGVGLLGGSLGQAVRNRGLAERVEGYVRREASIAECLSAGAVDEATMDLETAVRGADIVVLCTPVGQITPLAKRMAPLLKADAVVTDIGSVKDGLVANLEPMFENTEGGFVGSHPMAGAETTGVVHAREDLFDGAVCIVTPTPKSNAEAVRRVTALWHGVGASTVALSPELHDELVSRSSHLPHLLAAQLVNFVLDPRLSPHQRLLCAAGFRDCTRIASGSPGMWRDIALANRHHLSSRIAELTARLEAFRSDLEAADGEAILLSLTRAKECRDEWLRAFNERQGTRGD